SPDAGDDAVRDAKFSLVDVGRRGDHRIPDDRVELRHGRPLSRWTARRCCPILEQAAACRGVDHTSAVPTMSARPPVRKWLDSRTSLCGPSGSGKAWPVPKRFRDGGRGRHTMNYPRDLVGYGPRTPDPKWPGGARLALQIVINYEEGGE